MKRKQKLIWIAFAVVTVSIAVWFLTRPCVDFDYQGQKLSYWFDQLQKPAGERNKAQEAFQSLGPAAVPFLVERLQQRYPPWQKWYLSYYVARQSRGPGWLATRLPAPKADNTSWDRQEAEVILRSMGEKALPAAPALARATQDESWFVAQTAAQILESFGPTAEDTLPILLEGLSRSNAFASYSIVSAIVSVGRESPELIRMVGGKLSKPDPVRGQVLVVVARLGEKAHPLEKQIEPLLNSTNSGVRFAAVNALWAISPDRQIELLPHLAEFLSSADRQTSEAAGRQIVGMKALTPQAVELLTVAVQKNSDPFCWFAFGALEKRGPEASNSVPALLTGLHTKEARVAAKAATALGAIAAPDAPVLDALHQAQQHEFAMVRDAAEGALKKLAEREELESAGKKLP